MNERMPRCTPTGPTMARRLRELLLATAALVAVVVALTAPPEVAAMRSTKIAPGVCKTVGDGKFVKIPRFPGERIDRRLLRDIRWMVRNYAIFVTDGYSTALPTLGTASIRSASPSTSSPTDHAVGAGRRSPSSRSSPSRARTSRARPGAGSATTAIWAQRADRSDKDPQVGDRRAEHLRRVGAGGPRDRWRRADASRVRPAARFRAGPCPAFESGPRACPPWLALARMIRGA
jgi:hypothetical protein